MKSSVLSLAIFLPAAFSNAAITPFYSSEEVISPSSSSSSSSSSSGLPGLGKWQVSNFQQDCLPRVCTYSFDISGGREPTFYHEPVFKSRCIVGSQAQGVTPCWPTDVAVSSTQQNGQEVVLRLEHAFQDRLSSVRVEGNVTAIIGKTVPRSFSVVPTSISAVA